MLRRTFDLTAATLGLLVLAPVFVGVAIAIATTSPGPIFFRQERVGRGGKIFLIYKFRTMRQDAESVGGQLTVQGDPRVTRVGQLLRASKLDELPQLINVIAGEMALVGPRPEVPRYVARYSDAQRRVLDVRPGITDPASIRYRDESAVLASSDDPERAYLEQVMPEKLAINLDYLERRTLLSDVRVILATFVRILRRDPPD